MDLDEKRVNSEAIKKAVKTLGYMMDSEFVQFIRRSRTDNPDWWDFVTWTSAVELEVNCRLILKKAS